MRISVRNRTARLTATAGIAALVLAACASDGSAGTPASPAPTGGTGAAADTGSSGGGDEDDEECTPEEGALRIYLNPWGPDMSDPFTADTGIPAELADIGGGEILARIAAEANNPQWDIVLLDGHGSLQGLADQGMLLTGWEPASLANLTPDGAALVPSDRSWFPISEHAAAVIAWNTDAIGPEDAPTTWDDLLDPVYAPVGMADPAVAAPAYPVLSWFFQERGTGAEDYFGTLIDNGVNLYPRNGPVAQALASGEVNAAILQEHNVYGLMDSDEAVDFIWPDEGAPGVVRAIGISAATPRPCAAQALVEWLLTPEAISSLMDPGIGNDAIITPFVAGVDTSGLPELRPASPNIEVTDAQFAADEEIRIKDWFANRVAAG